MTDEELIADLAYLDPPKLGPKQTLHVKYVRDLGAADLEAPQEGTVKPPLLTRIHASHHALARCLAAGMKPSQAALVTGYCSSRISILQNDPAFIALVADYQLETKAAFADMAERMSGISLDALEIIQERLLDAPESFTLPVLLDLVRTFADRTGHGPNQEVRLRVETDPIDRPPRETFDQWSARRAAELNDTATGEAPSIMGEAPGEAASADVGFAHRSSPTTKLLN